MTTYTVHEPPLKGSEVATDAERFIFVRDGFTFSAFVLAPVWMIWHRLWLVLIGYVLVTVGLQLSLQWMGAPPSVAFAVNFLIALLVGFEAATLRRFGLARRGWRTAGTVVGDSLEAAERRFFDAWVRNGHEGWSLARPSPSATAAPILRGSQGSSDVIGLFPEPGARR